MTIGQTIFFRRDGMLWRGRVISCDDTTACILSNDRVLFLPVAECGVDEKLSEALVGNAREWCSICGDEEICERPADCPELFDRTESGQESGHCVPIKAVA